jgi:hypothetical protein
MWTVRDRVRAHDDAVLRGDVAGVPADLAPLAAFIAALRGRVALEPAPPMAGPLRAQLAAPNVVALRAARSARRALVFAAAVLAAVALIGIGAAQNRLPDELQDVVASTAEVLGVDVPHSSEREDDRSDAGLEHIGDDTVPAVPAAVPVRDREPGHEGLAPGGALDADPGGAGEQATSATPPVPEVEGSEKADEVEPAPRSGAPDSDGGAGGDLDVEADPGGDDRDGDDRGDDDRGDDDPGGDDRGGGDRGDDDRGDDDRGGDDRSGDHRVGGDRGDDDQGGSGWGRGWPGQGSGKAASPSTKAR